MDNQITTIGSVISLLNFLIIALLVYNMIMCYLYSINIEKTKTVEDLKLYIWVLLKTMIFFVANAIAAYTGFISFVMNPAKIDSGIVMWRCADRTGMLMISISLIFDRLKYNPLMDSLAKICRSLNSPND